MRQTNQRFSSRCIRQCLQRNDDFISLFSCPLMGSFQRTTSARRFQNRLQRMAIITLLNDLADHQRLFWGAVAHDMQQRQRRFTLIEIITDVFTQLLAIRATTQQIVD